jgi:hypothetical protein
MGGAQVPLPPSSKPRSWLCFANTVGPPVISFNLATGYSWNGDATLGSVLASQRAAHDPGGRQSLQGQNSPAPRPLRHGLVATVNLPTLAKIRDCKSFICKRSSSTPGIRARTRKLLRSTPMLHLCGYAPLLYGSDFIPWQSRCRETCQTMAVKLVIDHPRTRQGRAFKLCG